MTHLRGNGDSFRKTRWLTRPEVVRDLEVYLIRAEGVGFEPTSRCHLPTGFKSAYGSTLTSMFPSDTGNRAAYLPRSC